MSRRLALGLLWLATGCNTVLGLDPTELVNDHMRELVFDNSASKTDLIDFPVLVSLDSARVDYDVVTDPQTQLRFFDPDTGQDLPFEIERWDPAGRSEIWVKVPQIDARSTTDRIQLFFGPEAGGQEQPASVWPVYDFVYHGVPGKNRSSVGTFPGTATNVTTGEGAIGSAPRFADGVESSIEFANTTSLLNDWTRCTVEMWLYPDYAPSTNLGIREPQFFTNEASMQLGRVRTSTDGIDTLLTPQIDVHFDTGTSYMNPPIQRQAWVQLVYLYDGPGLWIFRNGTAVDLDGFSNFSSPPTHLVGGSQRLMLGARNNAMAGMIDEVRVSRTALSPDWIAAQYFSMSGKFLTFTSAGGSR